MLVISVVNLKGGSTKTTTAGHLLAAFHEAGQRVLGVDADGENESLIGWQEAAELPFPIIRVASGKIHEQLPGVAREELYDVVVIDTPPMKAQKGTVVSAIRIATHVIVPMAPTPIEYDRVQAVRDVIEEAGDLRLDGPPVFAVLLTRVKPRAASTKFYRDQLVDDGVKVLAAQIGSLERFAQSWGDPIVNATESGYGDAAMELLDLEKEISA